MNLKSRTVISHVAAASMALAGMLSAFQSAAQDYPNKPIRLVVPAPPGVGPDIEMRRISAHLSTILGQPVIIENRPGAATRIGIEYVIKSAPDGYTLLVGTPSMVTGPFLFSNLPFDAQRDLVPVGLASVTNYTLTINADVPAKTFAEYVALAKSDEKYADFATLGAGTILHLTAAWFGSLTGVNTRHIHYNTSSPFGALAAGQVPAMFDAMLPVLQLRNAGKLRTLAISGSKRHPLMPDVPTFAEVGHPGFQPLVWTGVLAPAGTPPAIVSKLSAAFSQVLKMKETVDHLASVGSEAVGSTPDEYAAFLDGERKKWGPIIRMLGLKLD